MSALASGLRERKKLDTWNALRAAALELIAARGYEAVTIDDIAAAADVSRRTFFNYFDSKEAVFFDPDPAEPALWATIANGRPAGEAIWESLLQFFLGYLSAHCTTLPNEKRVISASPTLARRSRATNEQFRTFLTAWVVNRIASDGDHRFDAAVLTNAALAVLNVAFTAWDPDSGADELERLIRRGFSTVVTQSAPPRRRKDIDR